MPKINSLTYNGTKSTDLGVFVTGSGSFNAAEQDIEKVEIAGRNGDLLLPKNRYKNIEVTYPAFIPDAFKENVQSIRNWMRSAKVYARLEDTYDMEHYRLGLASGVQSFEPANRNDASNFQMTFDCRPERFLKTGETESEVLPVTIEHSGDILEFDSLEETPLTKAELSLSPIQDLHGYSSPWAGGAGVNKFDPNTVTDGFIGSNGALNPQGSVNLEYISDYIPVSPSTQYTVMYSAYESGDSPYVAMCWYDSNKTFLRRDFRATASYTLQSHENAAYCRAFMRTFGHGTDKCYFAAGTSTTFSPWENLCPISGHTEAKVFRTGINQWDEEWEAGTIDATTGQNDTSSAAWRSKNYIPVVPSTQYYFCTPTGTSNAEARGRFYDANKIYIGTLSQAGQSIKTNRVFTTPDNAYYMRFCPNNTNIPNHDVSINYPSTDLDYHQYNGDTFTISLGQTVYGGTFDFVSGKMTVKNGIIADLSQQYWGNSGGQNGLFYTTVSGIKVKTAAGEENALCSAYKGSTTMYVSDLNDGEFITGSTNRIYMKNTAFGADGTAFKNSLSGVQFVYELDTPVEIDLTPQEIDTLLGQNVMWGNGEIEIAFSEPFSLTNPTQFEARPLLRVVNPEEDDVIDINGTTITFTDDFTGEMFIDCETMDAFAEGINANSFITATDFPVLNSGLNIVRWSGSGELYITPRWWEL